MLALLHEIRLVWAASLRPIILSLCAELVLAKKSTCLQGFDYRPVLDLDDVPDGLTAIFHEGGQGEVIVAYSEAGEASWNNALNLDIELPESGGLEFDIVYSTNEEGIIPARLEKCPPLN